MAQQYHFSFAVRLCCVASLLATPFFSLPGLVCLVCFLAGNQVAQSIRATRKDGQTSMEALHANAAHQQGVLSAAVAILEMAAGHPSLDANAHLQVTEDHVQAGVDNGKSVAFFSLFQ
jgi:hypothetical protein